MRFTSLLGLGLALVACSHVAEPATVVDPYDAKLASIRREIAPAAAAFHARDASALAAWLAEPGRSPAQRTYATGLLVRLGVTGSDRAFVDTFPATDGQSLRALADLEQALFESEYDFARVYSTGMLICGALRAWPGALDKLIAMRPFTDAGAHMDNCCALTLVAAAHPDAALASFAKADLDSEILHAFKEEASAGTAQQLHDFLISHSYSDAAQERLRLKLLPVLASKAALAERAPHVCEWLKCMEMGGLLSAQTPPNLALELTSPAGAALRD